MKNLETIKTKTIGKLEKLKNGQQKQIEYLDSIIERGQLEIKEAQRRLEEVMSQKTDCIHVIAEINEDIKELQD